jgi:hypothetical protein
MNKKLLISIIILLFALNLNSAESGILNSIKRTKEYYEFIKNINLKNANYKERLLKIPDSNFNIFYCSIALESVDAQSLDPADKMQGLLLVFDEKALTIDLKKTESLKKAIDNDFCPLTSINEINVKDKFLIIIQFYAPGTMHANRILQLAWDKDKNVIVCKISEGDSSIFSMQDSKEFTIEL